MAALIQVGSNPNNFADDLVTVTVRTGDTVTVANQSTSPNTINYHSQGHSGGATGTVAANANTSLTAPGTHYLSCAGHSYVKITGGIYGS